MGNCRSKGEVRPAKAESRRGTFATPSVASAVEAAAASRPAAYGLQGRREVAGDTPCPTPAPRKYQQMQRTTSSRVTRGPSQLGQRRTTGEKVWDLCVAVPAVHNVTVHAWWAQKPETKKVSGAKGSGGYAQKDAVRKEAQRRKERAVRRAALTWRERLADNRRKRAACYVAHAVQREQHLRAAAAAAAVQAFARSRIASEAVQRMRAAAPVPRPASSVSLRSCRSSVIELRGFRRHSSTVSSCGLTSVDSQSVLVVP